jgi:hypothetical protein
MRQGCLWWLLVAAALLPMGGCGTDSGQRIAWLEAQLKTSEGVIADLQPVVTALESEWLTLRTQWADPNNSAQVQSLAARMKMIEMSLGPKKASLEAALKIVPQYRAELEQAIQNGVAPGAEVQLYGKGVTAVGTAVGGPWGAVLAAAGMLLTGIGTAVVKGQRDKLEMANQKMDSDTAIGGIVASVKALLANPAVVPNPEAAKDILAREQVKVPLAAAAVRAELDKAADERMPS